MYLQSHRKLFDSEGRNFVKEVNETPGDDKSTRRVECPVSECRNQTEKENKTSGCTTPRFKDRRQFMFVIQRLRV